MHLYDTNNQDSDENTGENHTECNKVSMEPNVTEEKVEQVEDEFPDTDQNSEPKIIAVTRSDETSAVDDEPAETIEGDSWDDMGETDTVDNKHSNTSGNLGRITRGSNIGNLDL